MSRSSHANNVQRENADTTNDLSYNTHDSNMFDTSIIINELRNVPMTAERLKTLDDLIRLDDDDDITKQVESLQNFIRAKKAKQAAQNLVEHNEQNANEHSEPHINGALLGEDHRQKVSITIISPNKCIIKANDSIIGSIEERIEDEKEIRTNHRRSDEKRAQRSSERGSKRSEERKSGRSGERRSRRNEEGRMRHSEERRPRRSEERRSRRGEEGRSGKSEERRHRRNEEQRTRRSEERRLGRDERHPDDRRARRSEERRYRREESRMRRSEEKRLKASCPKGPRTPPNSPPQHNTNEYDENLMMKLPDGMDGRHMSYHDSIGAPNQYHQVKHQINCLNPFHVNKYLILSLF